MSQTRIMSIYGLLMRLFSAFCGRKALNGNAKHIVIDLTCDVTGDTGVKFLNFIWNILSGALHCQLNFSATSIGYRDSREGPLRPPPPPPAVGRRRTRPSRARVNNITSSGYLAMPVGTHVCQSINQSMNQSFNQAIVQNIFQTHNKT